MGIFREHTIVSQDNEEWDSWEVFEQPTLLHAIIKTVQAVTDHTHGLEWKLDPLAQRIHDVRCHDDCVTGTVARVKPYWRTPEGQAERASMGFVTPDDRPDMWETSIQTMCGRLPLCAAIDLKVERWSRRDRRPIGTVDGPRRPVDGRDPTPGRGPVIRFSAALSRKRNR